eukprot:CAMPEP_0171259222 /NCGR_PEP_ID=MMETSP0790-20130122/54814_1 /TAXON_ID=2925 /ORGANISM="Alexandrium catenella, Strain OF101" /LENGTH=41 /DNA_ID= /DNA_START= /DNA_END= /DNA_ORIENTATION=
MTRRELFAPSCHSPPGLAAVGKLPATPASSEPGRQAAANTK